MVEARVAVDLVVIRRFRDADLAPIGIEILGEDQRQRRAHALTHFDRGRDDGNDIVVADGDPRIGGNGAAADAEVGIEPKATATPKAPVVIRNERREVLGCGYRST